MYVTYVMCVMYIVDAFNICYVFMVCMRVCNVWSYVLYGMNVMCVRVYACSVCMHGMYGMWVCNVSDVLCVTYVTYVVYGMDVNDVCVCMLRAYVLYVYTLCTHLCNVLRFLYGVSYVCMYCIFVCRHAM